MRKTLFVTAIAVLGTASVVHTHVSARTQSNLCSLEERVVFSCVLQKSAKAVALCASKDLGKQSGYLQYRFGLPGKVELEFPQKREGSAQSFLYSHYFRAQVDSTEISFKNEGTEYTVFDEYNGEEKPAVSEQGVRVAPAGGAKEVTLVCKGRAKANFDNLENVLPRSDQ